MSEPKPFASLSSSLLARKGTAKPAMRPQAFHISGDLTRPVSQQDDDLGWNDMGDDVAIIMPAAPTIVPEPDPLHEPVALHGAPVPEAVVSPVIVQQQKLAQQFSAVEVAQPVLQKAVSAKSKAAFTLRLDADRHLRLRLLCALQHRSAQQVVTQALDQYLAQHPDIDTALSRTA